MMNKKEHNEVLRKESLMERDIRDIIKHIVVIRLDAMRILQWLKAQEYDLTDATEEMSEAVDTLYETEKALGNAHQLLLVSGVTLSHRGIDRAVLEDSQDGLAD